MFGYIFIPLFVLAVAVSGSLLTMPEINGWYSNLQLPSFVPSGAVIGLVWTILFILLAWSGILFWKANDKVLRSKFLILFILNGILNVGWSYLFFHLHNISGAFAEIWFLNLSIVLLIWLLWAKHRLVGYLLVPYFLWVSFATYLTFSVLALNR